MGETSEMVQDGILCKKCLGFVGAKQIKKYGGEIDEKKLEVVSSPGFPILCDICSEEDGKDY